MIPTENTSNLEQARKLIDGFARRTGISGNGGNLEQRYLWTDAFAVQTLFGLAHALRVRLVWFPYPIYDSSYKNSK